MADTGTPTPKLTVRASKARAMLGISRDSLRELIKSGKLRASRPSPKLTLIRVADIDAMLEETRL